MHALATSFVLGYHGCDKTVAERLVAGKPFRPSDNAYDWLGPGVYFWEANPRRGLDFAKELALTPHGRSRVTNPDVVGAIIELGLCLDLTTSAGVRQVRAAHQQLRNILRKSDLPLPENNIDGLRRNLDCAVLRTLHQSRSDRGEAPIDCIKGIFIEGRPIYGNSGFHDKTHVQICVCNPERIKGVFRAARRFLKQ